MEVDAFRRAVTNGLGRPILWLREHSWRPHVGALEHVCLHNTAYDPQCEGSRAEYVYAAIRLTDAPQHFADVAVKGLLEATDFWDTVHLFSLVRLLARDGHSHARAALYEKFRRDDAEQHFLGADQIVKLNGTEGLLFAADWIGRWLEGNPGYWVDDELILEAEEELGDRAAAAIRDAAGSSPHVRRYVEAVEKYRQTPRPQQTPDYRHFTYPELRTRIVASSGGVPRGWLFGWGKHAPEDALREAASDLLKEGDEQVLLAYLRIFNHRPFPLDHNRLIQLATSESADVATAAFRALRQVRSPAIHRLALALIRRGQAGGDVIQLLAKNHAAGDDRLIESLLTESSNESNEDEFHGQAHAAVDVFRPNRDGDALPSMLRVYENVRCSICRMSAVDILVNRRTIPEWMVAECRYDSNTYIRQKAESLDLDNARDANGDARG